MPAPWNESWRQGRQTVRIGILMVCLLWMAGSGSPIHAHGSGEPLLAHEEVGPYILYVWIEPWPGTTGEMHVTVSVNEPVADRSLQTYPVLDANVTIVAKHLDLEVDAVRVQATHEHAVNKLFYEGRLWLAAPGIWELQLDIQAAAGNITHTWIVDVGGDPQPVRTGFGQRLLDWFRSLWRRV